MEQVELPASANWSDSPPNDSEHGLWLRIFIGFKQSHVWKASACQEESLQAPWNKMSSSSYCRLKEGASLSGVTHHGYGLLVDLKNCC